MQALILTFCDECSIRSSGSVAIVEYYFPVIGCVRLRRVFPSRGTKAIRRKVEGGSSNLLREMFLIS